MNMWLRCVWCFAVLISTFLVAEPSAALVEAKGRAEAIGAQVQTVVALEERTGLLEKNPLFLETFVRVEGLKGIYDSFSKEQKAGFALMLALNGGTDVLYGASVKNGALFSELAHVLATTDQFYKPIGGLLGYYTTALKLMASPEAAIDAKAYAPVPYEDIQTKNRVTLESAYDGISHVGSVAHIFALGGAGDRLNLLDRKTGEPLPAAKLLFMGRTLFSGLMRDVEAEEYLHYRVFGTQKTIPVLIMTSQEKNNDAHIYQMCKEAFYFGRDPSTIFRMVQPLVPVITTDGQFAANGPATLLLKPGGHGVIWKLASDSGALDWLKQQSVTSAVVRQVNNPLAGIDDNLAVLSGYGLHHKKAFGFFSCKSRPGFAEGLNVLRFMHDDNGISAAISNIEYTHFGVLKAQRPEFFAEGALPANTNILYVNLEHLQKALLKDPIPGMLVNAKTALEYKREGENIVKYGGRLESCMQNIADVFATKIDQKNYESIAKEQLDTFLLLAPREKTISTAKKAFCVGQNPQETPYTCLYDWNKAVRMMLLDSCGFTLPKEQTFEDFLHNGPSYQFSFHPAMGPLWSIIGQKCSSWEIHPGSFIDLEIAEIAASDIDVTGSFCIHAKSVTGSFQKNATKVFDDKVGRARLHKVRIHNKGAPLSNIDGILQGSISHEETCTIILEGFSEIEATNVDICGPFYLVVPDGKKAILSQGLDGKVLVRYEAISVPSWKYTFEWERGKAPILKMA